MVAVAVKWPKPKFTRQFDGGTTVQREPARVRETSEGLCGAEFRGLVGGKSSPLSQQQLKGTLYWHF